MSNLYREAQDAVIGADHVVDVIDPLSGELADTGDGETVVPRFMDAF